MQPVVIVKDDRYALHLEKVPHLESPRRYRAMQDVLADFSLKGRLREVVPRMASPEELAWVHTREHIEQVARSAQVPLTSFDLDTEATEKSYDVARLAVGGVFSLLDEICSGRGNRGFACIRPPGHHAEPHKAMGFCLFNNAALGARYLKEQYSLKKVMIVDIDVHHGNGTQAAFYDTDEVLFLSFHQFPGYPGTGNYGEVGVGKGAGYTVNIPLAKGHGDSDFGRIIYFFINPLAQMYQPEIILVSCGFDLYHRDRLGGMKVTPGGYGLITFFLTSIAEKVCDGRIAFILEGGYSLKGIKECGLAVMQALCGLPVLTAKEIDRIIGDAAGARKVSSLRKVMDVQKKYWKFPA
ncbi:MAG: histone deacetylase [Deltaproteobacteria bacterium]|nr:histone deacetylase [Deltaproteobacteria bacterium]